MVATEYQLVHRECQHHLRDTVAYLLSNLIHLSADESCYRRSPLIKISAPFYPGKFLQQLWIPVQQEVIYLSGKIHSIEHDFIGSFYYLLDKTISFQLGTAWQEQTAILVLTPLRPLVEYLNSAIKQKIVRIVIIAGIHEFHQSSCVLRSSCNNMQDRDLIWKLVHRVPIPPLHSYRIYPRCHCHFSLNPAMLSNVPWY